MITLGMEEMVDVVERAEPTRVESDERALMAEPGRGTIDLEVATGTLRAALRGEGGGEGDIWKSSRGLLERLVWSCCQPT